MVHSEFTKPALKDLEMLATRFPIFKTKGFRSDGSPAGQPSVLGVLGGGGKGVTHYPACPT